MTLNFWKARRAKAIEQLRDDILAAAQSGLKLCMYVRDEELSEDDRQATYEAAQLFAAIGTWNTLKPRTKLFLLPVRCWISSTMNGSNI